ncbi:hypothetical protein [Kineococcus esterisolvens]|uniref:hypothetical protein n=1 Tax=Kineococcus sp. SYSU DK009 TaxID=3383130 RepID=UPI003D7CA679
MSVRTRRTRFRSVAVTLTALLCAGAAPAAAGAAVEAETAAVESATGAAAGEAGREFLKTPALAADALVWRPSATNRTFTAPSDRDVRIEWPSTPVDVEGGLQLNGGRNVVSVGGTVKPSKRYFPSGQDTPNDNRCLYITGNNRSAGPRTVHIEGLHCAGEHIWEGINIDARGERGSLTVNLRNILIDGVNVEYPGGSGKHIGGDALQVWNGPHALRVDGFTAKNLEYQGFFLQPYSRGSGSLGDWDIRNVNLVGADSGSAFLLWVSSLNRIDVDWENVYVEGGGDRSRSRTVWQSGSYDSSEVVSGLAPRDYVRPAGGGTGARAA